MEGDLRMMATEECIKKRLMKATREASNEIHNFTLEIIMILCFGLLFLELDMDHLREKDNNFIFYSLKTT